MKVETVQILDDKQIQKNSKMVLFEGDVRKISSFALEAAVDLQLNGNADGVLFIDAGNVLDARILKGTNRMFVSKPKSALDLRKLVDEELESFLEWSTVNVIVIPSIKVLFRASRLEDAEAIVMMDKLLSKIEWLSEKYDLIVFMGSERFDDPRDKDLNHVLDKKPLKRYSF